MPTTTGDTVRLRRVRLGLTVAQVGRSTGVPEDFLRAVEEGRPDRGAPTPAYDDAWLRVLVRFLDRAEARVDRGLPWDASTSSSSRGEDPEAAATFAAPGADTDGEGRVKVSTRPVPGNERRSRWSYAQIRVLAALCVGTAAALLMVWGAQLGHRWWNLPVPAAPPVEVDLRVVRAGALVVAVDGRTVLDQKVERGDRFRWRGAEEVVVDVEDPFAVAVDFEGRDISPRGHRDRPRRMVFLSDGGRP